MNKTRVWAKTNVCGNDWAQFTVSRVYDMGTLCIMQHTKRKCVKTLVHTDI